MTHPQGARSQTRQENQLGTVTLCDLINGGQIILVAYLMLKHQNRAQQPLVEHGQTHTTSMTGREYSIKVVYGFLIAVSSC